GRGEVLLHGFSHGPTEMLQDRILNAKQWRKLELPAFFDEEIGAQIDVNGVQRRVQGNLAFPARREKEYASGCQVPLNHAATIGLEDDVHRAATVQDHEETGDGVESSFGWALALHRGIS